MVKLYQVPLEEDPESLLELLELLDLLPLSTRFTPCTGDIVGTFLSSAHKGKMFQLISLCRHSNLKCHQFSYLEELYLLYFPLVPLPQLEPESVRKRRKK